MTPSLLTHIYIFSIKTMKHTTRMSKYKILTCSLLNSYCLCDTGIRAMRWHVICKSITILLLQYFWYIRICLPVKCVESYDFKIFRLRTKTNNWITEKNCTLDEIGIFCKKYSSISVKTYFNSVFIRNREINPFLISLHMVRKLLWCKFWSSGKHKINMQKQMYSDKKFK